MPRVSLRQAFGLAGGAAAPAAGEAGPQAGPDLDRADEQDVFAAVVTGLFRAILGREAGPEGVRLWREAMGQTFNEVPLDDFIARLTSATLGSAEFDVIYTAPLMALLRARLLPPRASVGISTHVSLGADGFASSMFKRYGLKRWSGPFDWCSTSPAIIRAVLADDFEAFLDPDQWRPIALEDRPDGRFWQCHHPAYEQRHGHACILHNHDMTQDWGQVGLLRAVERFRASIRSLASKLVLQVVREGDDPGGEFLRTAEALDGMGRNIHFVMVSVLPEPTPGPFPEVEPALAKGAHRLLRARLLAPLDGIEAKDMLDEVVLLRAALAAPMLGQDLQQP